MSDFFSMGGHGFYIWASYGMTALFMIVEVLVVVLSNRAVRQRLTRMVRAEARTSHRQKD